MYLLTFSFLVIALLGIYAQMVAVETSRINQGQSGIAQTMLYWHGAALSLASSVVSPFPIGPTPPNPGCGLTSGASAPFPALCAHSALVGGPAGVAVNGGSYTLGTSTFPMIASGYTVLNYPWKSITYQNLGTYYVITYIDPPAAAGGFITNGAGGQIGITQSDLYKQIQNAGISNMNYGYVTGGNLVTTVNVSGTQIIYPVPPAVATGSLGIISTTNPCSGC